MNGSALRYCSYAEGTLRQCVLSCKKSRSAQLRVRIVAAGLRFAGRMPSGHDIPVTSQPSIGVDAELPRREFPSRDTGLYFNHAAIAPWPASTARAVQAFATENVLQGPARYAQWIALEQSLRRNLATLLGAASEHDIALLKNTTEGISTVAWGLDWRAGDNLVLPKDEFFSNRLPWLAQRRRGVEVREIDIRAASSAEDALIGAMDEHTRLLTVSSVQWNDGFRLDLQALGSACRDRGVLFFVDAIQQLGALRLDVASSHVSFLAADAHKWLLGPEGIAVFYCRDEVRPQLCLLQQGWHMFDNPWRFERADDTPSASARRFEAGSPNTLGQVAFKASLDLLLTVGMEEIEHRILSNTAYLQHNLQSLDSIRVVSNAEPMRCSGIVTFRPEKVSAAALQRALAVRQVSCAVRDQAIRLSPHFYQGAEEIDRVINIVREELDNAQA
jgi:cysteine desulfurase/selenocysteine lyase